MEPTQSDALSVLAYALMQNARPAKSVVLLEALDLFAPANPSTLQALAAAQVRSAKPGRALETLDRLAMAGGAGPLFHLLRAQALSALERHQEAVVAMKAFLESRDPPGTPP